MSSLISNLRGARWLSVTALLLCCVLYAQARAQNGAGAQEPPPPPAAQDAPRPLRPAERDRRILPLLNLTPEQRTQLLAIAERHQVEKHEAQLRLRTARRALNQAIYAENPDQNLVNERAREVADANAALIRLEAQARLKVRQVLTPEQLRKFRELERDFQRRQRAQPDGRPRRLPRDRP